MKVTEGALRKGLAFFVFFLQILFAPLLFSAPPFLRCEIYQSGEKYVLDFVRRDEPYGAEAKDINERFRFKAVVIGDEQHIKYVKIYTYYKEQHQVVLLHEVKYLPPFRQSSPGFAALTGINYLYSPVMERELQYGCAFVKFQNDSHS